MDCYKDEEKIGLLKKKQQCTEKSDVIQNWTIAYSLAVVLGPVVNLSQVGHILL